MGRWDDGAWFTPAYISSHTITHPALELETDQCLCFAMQAPLAGWEMLRGQRSTGQPRASRSEPSDTNRCNPGYPTKFPRNTSRSFRADSRDWASSENSGSSRLIGQKIVLVCLWKRKRKRFGGGRARAISGESIRPPFFFSPLPLVHTHSGASNHGICLS